jgi:hypothetical protein
MLDRLNIPIHIDRWRGNVAFGESTTNKWRWYPCSSSEGLTGLFSLLAADKAFSNEDGLLRFQHPAFLPSLGILILPRRVLLLNTPVHIA